MPEPTCAADLVRLLDAYGVDHECRDYLENLRWPDGVGCPRCQSEKVWRIRERNQFDCVSCRYQFSVTAGTIFHDSHLALPKWFIAIYLMCESKEGLSANQVKRAIGVSYKTAWYLCHRIREAMKEVIPSPLKGIVEMNEAYIGGRGDVRASTVEGLFSLFKRSVVGAFHQVSAKHLDRYLDEFEFRFNNRKNPYLFRDTLLRLIAGKRLQYEKLTASIHDSHNVRPA